MYFKVYFDVRMLFVFSRKLIVFKNKRYRSLSYKLYETAYIFRFPLFYTFYVDIELSK